MKEKMAENDDANENDENVEYNDYNEYNNYNDAYKEYKNNVNNIKNNKSIKPRFTTDISVTKSIKEIFAPKKDGKGKRHLLHLDTNNLTNIEAPFKIDIKEEFLKGKNKEKNKGNEAGDESYRPYRENPNKQVTVLDYKSFNRYESGGKNKQNYEKNTAINSILYRGERSEADLFDNKLNRKFNKNNISNNNNHNITSSIYKGKNASSSNSVIKQKRKLLPLNKSSRASCEININKDISEEETLKEGVNDNKKQYNSNTARLNYSPEKTSNKNINFDIIKSSVFSPVKIHSKTLTKNISSLPQISASTNNITINNALGTLSGLNNKEKMMEILDFDNLQNPEDLHVLNVYIHQKSKILAFIYENENAESLKDFSCVSVGEEFPY